MEDAFVIDADGHFNEPQELFASYLAPEFRWAAPKMVVDNQGRNRSMIGGEMMPFIPQPKRITADGGRAVAVVLPGMQWDWALAWHWVRCWHKTWRLACRAALRLLMHLLARHLRSA